MTLRSRVTLFRVLFAIALLYGLVLLIPGCEFAFELPKYGVHDWQEVTLMLLMISFAPLVVFAWFRPKQAAAAFCCVAILSVVQVLAITRSTGDGLGAGLVGALFFVGIPAALAGALFYFVDPRDPRTRSIVSK